MTGINRNERNENIEGKVDLIGWSKEELEVDE
jgi:hypothetical protein